MDIDKFYKSNSATNAEGLASDEVDKNVAVGKIIQQYADLGAVHLETIPAEEYDGFKDKFLANFKGTDTELADAILAMHENPLYGKDGMVYAYQVYTYLDTSAFSREQVEELDDLHTKLAEVLSNN